MSHRPDSERWLVRAPMARPRRRVICLPHAGGAASAFADWRGAFRPDVEVAAVQLPGRASRMFDPPLAEMGALVEALGAVLTPLMDVPTWLVGHSMGAHVAFALARWFAARPGPAPAHVFAMGRPAPHLPPPADPVHRRGPDGIAAELARLGGTPPEVLSHRELLDLLLPGLRADFRVAETYRVPPTCAIECPLSAYGGRSDPDVSEDAVWAWRHHAAGRFTVRVFEGGHFFLHREIAAVVAAMEADAA
ncbi:MAG: thioesterase domain-containing protein [bacterium]